MTVTERILSPVTNRWLQIVQAEYLEMPGMDLTRSQIQRLWGLESDVCDAIVTELIARRVLRQTSHGTYVAYGSRH